MFPVSLTLLFLFSTTLSAHGPSRQKVSEKIQINAESSKVWSIVKNFKENGVNYKSVGEVMGYMSPLGYVGS